MEILNYYFENLVFTKVDKKEGFFIYGANIHTNYGGGIQRYILLFVPDYIPSPYVSKIKDLKWVNLQTRELSVNNYKPSQRGKISQINFEGYGLKKQMWKIPENIPDFLLIIKNRSQTHSEFEMEKQNYCDPQDKNCIQSEFPFEILLLHNSKRKTIYQYNNHMMLSAAIESFKSIFNYKGDFTDIPHSYIS